MTVESLLQSLGPEIEDPEEESFLLFSQSIPSQNLGFVDQKAKFIDLSIGGRDLVVHQSPTILSSTRSGGTTGAVVWKITPLFASWISSPANPFHAHKIFHPASSVLELGSGISGIIGLCLGPQIRSYALTDQEYVLKLLHQNLEENRIGPATSSNKGRKSNAKSKRGVQNLAVAEVLSNITAHALDWETDEISAVAGKGESFDAIIACDCIYNDALIAPLVQTCVDACRLRQDDRAADEGGSADPTVCIIAQQLRSDEVFEGWLREFRRSFRVWRVPDSELIEGLKENSGFVVHVGVLR